MGASKMLSGLIKLLCDMALLLAISSAMCSGDQTDSAESSARTPFYNSPIFTLVWVIGNLVVAVLIVIGVIVWYQYLPIDDDPFLMNDAATANPADINVIPIGKAASSSGGLAPPVLVSSSPDVIDEKKD